MRMVPDVEELRPEVEPHRFVRQSNVLDKGQVCIDKSRPRHRRPRGISQFSSRGRIEGCIGDETRCIEPLGERWVTGFRVTTRNQVRPVQTVSVPLEIDSRSVGAIDREKRESGDSSFNHIDFPTAGYGVQSAIPVAAKSLALANGKS